MNHIEERIGRCFRRLAFGGATGVTACTLAWVFLMAPGALGAADDPLPDAALILDKYVEVTGGKAAYDKIYNRVSEERLVHLDMGFEDSLTEYHARPNKRYVEIESDTMGPVSQGTDGKVSWYLSEQTGPLIEHGEVLLANLDTAAFDRVVNWREYYQKVECVSKEDLDGKTCYKIVLTPNHGEREIHYYDEQSGLLVRGEKTRLSNNMPALRAKLSISDYRWVDGLLIPHKVKQAFDMCGSTREMLFVTESVKHNVELPPDRFDPPEEIQLAARAADDREAVGAAGSTPCCPSGGTRSGGTGCAGSKGGVGGGCGAAPAGGCGGGGGGEESAEKPPPQPKRDGGCCGGT